MNKPIHPAVAEHVMEENERLRGLLRCARTQLEDSGISNVLRGQIDAALSQQAEPRCEYCDGTGDVHRADGEWLGECRECDADEPSPAQLVECDACPTNGGCLNKCMKAKDETAPAQDEREAFVAWATRLYNTGYHAGHHDTVEGGYTHVYRQDMDSYHEEVVVEWLTDNPQPTSPTRPAQAEQQPVAEVAAVGHWERSLVATWPADEDDAQGAWIIGTTDEDGNRYEVITIEADQYDAPGDSEKIARALLKLWSQAFAAPIAQTAPQPEQSGLVEAASGALAAIQGALEDAYHNAYPECCGQAHLECCGSPIQAWSEADQKTMEHFTPHERALRAVLSAQGGPKP